MRISNLLATQFFIVAGFTMLCQSLFAQHTPVPLWENPAPGILTKYYLDTSLPTTKLWLRFGADLGVASRDTPHIIPYLAPPAINNGCGILLCPGGAYAFLDFDVEGVQVANWFNSEGISVFILDYRHAGKGYSAPYPLLDAQRAMRFIRNNAEKWQVNPNKLGVMGYSAGGHLAASLGTHFDFGVKEDKDIINRQSCRPDFMLLIYPIITMGRFTHKWSKENLLGNKVNKPLTRYYSNELQVTAKTPPAFLVHAVNDSSVPYENSLLFFKALKNNKVIAELHLYQGGEHGFGIGLQDKNVATYTVLMKEWLSNNKFL